MEEPIMKHLYLTILFLLGGMNCVMAQTDHSVAKDTQQNQVQLTLTDGDVKYYNTGDVEKIKFEEKQVKVIQTAGDDVFDNQVENIAFFKAVKVGVVAVEAMGFHSPVVWLAVRVAFNAQHVVAPVHVLYGFSGLKGF